METNASLDGDNSLCVIFIIGKKKKEIIYIETKNNQNRK